MQQWRLEMGARSVWEGDNLERRWTIPKVRGKTENRFKNCSCFCKTRDFRDWIKSPHSRQLKPPKHSRTKFWKNFLSVFRDWKVYPRVSRELSRENLWVNLATGPSTREQVAKTDQRRCDWGSRLDTPATEPPKQGKTVFLKFSDFSAKHFPKTPKTLKNLFVLELTKIEYVKTHFIKYNHTNEYGIYQT